MRLTSWSPPTPSLTPSLSLSLPLNSPQAAGLDAAFDGLADALDGWNASAIQDKVHDKVAAAVDKAAAALHGAKAGAKEVYYNTKKGDKKQAVVDGLAEAKAKLSPAFGAWKGKNVVLFLSDQETPLLNVPPGFEAANLPGLTRLRKNGVEFLRSYTNACMCTAARATLFTGRYNTQHNARYVLETTMPDTLYPQINTPADLINMAAAAEAAGYDVVYKGKMHLTKPANPDFTVRARGSGGGGGVWEGWRGGLWFLRKDEGGRGSETAGARDGGSATARRRGTGARGSRTASALRDALLPPAAARPPAPLSDSPPSNLSHSATRLHPTSLASPHPLSLPFPLPQPHQWTSADAAKYGFSRWNFPDAGANQSLSESGGSPFFNDRRFMVSEGDPEEGKEGVFQYLRRRAKSVDPRPFFLVISLVNPHDVLFFPPQFNESGYSPALLEGGVNLPLTYDEDLSTKPAVQQQWVDFNLLIGAAVRKQKRGEGRGEREEERERSVCAFALNHPPRPIPAGGRENAASISTCYGAGRPLAPPIPNFFPTRTHTPLDLSTNQKRKKNSRPTRCRPANTSTFTSISSSRRTPG